MVPCIVVSTLYILLTIILAEILRKVVGKTFPDSLAKNGMYELITGAELCGCCFELANSKCNKKWCYEDWPNYGLSNDILTKFMIRQSKFWPKFQFIESLFVDLLNCQKNFFQKSGFVKISLVRSAIEILVAYRPRYGKPSSVMPRW